MSDSSSSVANITPDTAPLILEIQSSTEETQEASANNHTTSDQIALTSFTSEIHDLQYSDSSVNNSSCNNSILERMDLLELKLLEAQKDLAEFDGNLNAVSHLYTACNGAFGHFYKSNNESNPVRGVQQLSMLKFLYGAYKISYRKSRFRMANFSLFDVKPYLTDF